MRNITVACVGAEQYTYKKCWSFFVYDIIEDSFVMFLCSRLFEDEEHKDIVFYIHGRPVSAHR